MEQLGFYNQGSEGLTRGKGKIIHNEKAKKKNAIDQYVHLFKVIYTDIAPDQQVL